MMAATVAPVEAHGHAVARAPAGRSFVAKNARWLLALIVVTSALVTILASHRNSTTFDEVVLIAGGARGYALGVFDLAPEHPPLMQYVYGLPVHLSHPTLPAEVAVRPAGLGFRYVYARDFFWASGNDGERMAFAARLPAALIGALLVLVTFAFTSARYGAPPALLAAGLVAFLPDVLGHGMVAYNDLPLALLFLTTMWAADAMLRQPTAGRAALLGLSFALAMGVKFSAIVALPAIALMTLAEARVRRLDRTWLVGFATSTAVALAVCYVALVMLYLGDFALAEMRYGLDFTFGHVSRGHGAPAYLLGNISAAGWWYFFPAAFALKTPVAFQILTLTAAIGFAGRGRATGAASAGDGVLSSPVRPLVCGATVFAGALLSSHLAIGFRYALPLLPLFAILTAVGVSRVWMTYGTRVRAAIAVAVIWFAASSLSDYPHFLAYTSEFGSGRDRGDRLLLDSSLDWGQGLIDLRSFMRREHAQSVYLSYFGSALPQGYGIDYVPLASYFPLPAVDRPVGAAPPRFIVVSATNLHGIYLPGDPFARLRDVEPYAVLGHTLFVYRVDE